MMARRYSVGMVWLIALAIVVVTDASITGTSLEALGFPIVELDEEGRALDTPLE